MNKRTIALVCVVFTVSATSSSTQSVDILTKPNVPILIQEILPPKEEPLVIPEPPEEEYTFGKFLPPLEDWIVTSQFGIRDDVWGGPDPDFHKGTDLVSNKKDAKILASADGVVITHYLPPGTVRGNKVYKGHPVYGALIIIAHENGVYTLYSHMSKTFIHEGQIVKAGEAIGVIGKTGQATGVHLHFEILFDPMFFCFN